MNTTTEPTFIKCPCNHCGEHIEFDQDSLGSDTGCPHCGITTHLYIPQDKQSKATKKRWWQSKPAPPLPVKRWVGRPERPLGEISIGALLFLIVGFFVLVFSTTSIHQIQAILLFGFGGLFHVVRIVGHRIHKTVLATRINSDLIEEHTRKLVEQGLPRIAHSFSRKEDKPNSNGWGT